jgi:hypothetical protein
MMTGRFSFLLIKKAFAKRKIILKQGHVEIFFLLLKKAYQLLLLRVNHLKIIVFIALAIFTIQL